MVRYLLDKRRLGADQFRSAVVDLDFELRVGRVLSRRSPVSPSWHRLRPTMALERRADQLQKRWDSSTNRRDTTELATVAAPKRTLERAPASNKHRTPQQGKCASSHQRKGQYGHPAPPSRGPIVQIELI